MSLLERIRPGARDPLPQGSVIGLRWGALSRQRRTSVGIDFGAGSLKIAQIRWTRQGARLENYAILPVTGKGMDEGAIKDTAGLGDLLRRGAEEMGLTQSIVGTSIGGPNVLMRYINIPRVSEEEMRSAMKFEAPQHLPIPEDQLVYDFTPVPEATGVPEHQVSVFLSGTHKRLVESFLTTLSRAGMRPTAMELDCLAALRTLQWTGLVPNAQIPLVLLDFGEMNTRISVVRYGVPMLARTIATGLYHLRMAIADTLQISAGEAEMTMRTRGVKEDFDLSQAVEPWLSGLMESVGRSIEFFLIQNRGAALERVFLTGGGAMLPNLPEALGTYLSGILSSRPEAEKLKVERVSLAGLDINSELLPFVHDHGPLLTNALGAAMREGLPA